MPFPRPGSRRTRRGFSLLELIVCLVVIAVLGAITVPAFRANITRSQRASETESLATVARNAAALAALDATAVTSSHLTTALDECSGCASTGPAVTAGTAWILDIGDPDGDGDPTRSSAVHVVAHATTAAGAGLVKQSPTGGWVWARIVDGTVTAGHVGDVADADDVADGTSPYTPEGGSPGGSTPPSPPPGPSTVTVAYDGDPTASDGLFWHLGTDGGTKAFTNPTLNGTVDITVNHARDAGTRVETAFDDNPTSLWVNDAATTAFFVADLGPHRTFDVDTYALRSQTYDAGGQLRHWTLEGSTDGSTWSTLHTTSNSTLTNANPWAAWDVTDPSDDTGWRYLRFTIHLVACNCSAARYSQLSDFEVYGTLTTTPSADNLAFTGFGDGNDLWSAIDPTGNPALTGEIEVLSSHGDASRMAHNVTAPAGHWYTGSSGSGAWIHWDLGPNRSIDVTRYVIDSYNDPALPRNWLIEGRTGPAGAWTPISAHAGDVRIRHADSIHGWWVDDGPAAYRELRFRFTGASTVSGYQVLQHVTFYGNFTDGGAPWFTPFPTAGADGAGILSSLAGTPAFPAVTHNAATGGYPGANLVDRTGAIWHVQSASGAVTVDFGAGHAVTVHRYALRTTSDAAQLRNWQLQGSNDGTTWTPLSTHTGDPTFLTPSFTGTNRWASWWIDQNQGPWRYIRVQITGNSTVSNYQAVDELELYGTHT